MPRLDDAEIDAGDDYEIRPNAVTRRILRGREEKREEMRALARHYQLTDEGKFNDEESQEKLSRAERDAQLAALHDFPPIPEIALRELERLIGAYGLPMEALSSDKAAFVFRRVVSDFHRMRTLYRDYALHARAIFTPEELNELMRVLGLRPYQLAELVDPARKNAVNGAIHRWARGQSVPSAAHSTSAAKINRLIEQHVRRPNKARVTGESPRPSGAAKRRRRSETLRDSLRVPLASASRERKEDDGEREEP
jgi:hypothetical protein